MIGKPRITFGIIVCNGEPFTKYCLSSLYPYAHEILVVEGGTVNAQHITGKDAHSKDETLHVLRRFKKEQDPQGKLTLITKKGFWSEKDEMSKAYAKKASGDYLWQVDIDEFYTERNMKAIIKLLQAEPSITALSFKSIFFWGDLNTITDGWSLRRGRDIFHRLFKWGDGYEYTTHRPPTVVDEKGIDLRKANYIDGNYLFRKHDIYLNHYSLLFPHQVLAKAQYYANYSHRKKSVSWAKNNYLKLTNPFRVHNVYESPSWLQPHSFDHPLQVKQMWEDVRSENPQMLRDMKDVNQLLESSSYKQKRYLYQKLDYLDRLLTLPRYLCGGFRSRTGLYKSTSPDN